jgi:membrane-bound lytic murein transglycosylase B/type II secretory pathway pseudopilin PulG
VPFTKFVKITAIIFVIWFSVLGSVVAPTIQPFIVNAASNDEERQALEAQLKELESQISQYETQIISYQKQGSTLKSEVTRLNNNIAKLNLQIKAINLTLAQLDQKISETQSQIAATEGNIASNKLALGDLLKNIYAADRSSFIEIFLKNPKLSDFFTDLNNTAILQNSLQSAIKQISDLRDQLKEQKDQFALTRADAATLKDYQLAQKNETDQIKQEKNTLLAITKGQESKYQTILKQTKETAAKIRSRIFQLLGGGELTFEQAYQYAKLASGATGVRSAFILAVLDRESALGQNVGRCNYKTAMNPKDQPIFLEITSALNINPDTITVSCPNADGAYGGAMGPAQFIPSTWRIYADKVSQITGRTPASPWNNADAFVAAALYLKDAGADKNERVAAAKYYCGSRWNRYVCTNVYGWKVVERAQQFQEDIDTITS